MCNLLVQVFQQILRISISLSMTVRWTTHLTRRRSRRLLSLTYFREISYRTLSWWVRWASILVQGPLIPNMMLPARHHTTLLVRPPDCPALRHRQTQDTSTLAVKFGRETHTARLSFRRCFVGVDVLFFPETVVYINFFYFLIYGFKFSFPYLCFDINFLQNFHIT
jgi:hypothetical protein